MGLGSEEHAVVAARYLALTHLNDHMQRSIRLDAMLDSILLLLKQNDTELYTFLFSGSKAVSPYFMISWLLTWFTHDTNSAVDLIEFCLEFEERIAGLVPVYLSAAVILLNRDIIKREDREELHQLLKTLPKHTPVNQWKELSLVMMCHTTPRRLVMNVPALRHFHVGGYYRKDVCVWIYWIGVLFVRRIKRHPSLFIAFVIVMVVIVVHSNE